MSTITHERRGHVIVKLATKEPILNDEGTVVGHRLVTAEESRPHESINQAKRAVRTQHQVGTVRVKK